MQERLTEEIADLLMKELEAKGVAVVIEASHSCMTIRGVNKPDSSFVTSAMRGGIQGKTGDAFGSDVPDFRLEDMRRENATGSRLLAMSAR